MRKSVRCFSNAVSCVTRENVHVIDMNDGKMNAFNFALLQELNKALDDVPKSAKSILLRGNHKAFSAGFDLSIMLAGDMNRTAALIQEGANFAMRLYTQPLPVVAAVSGHAMAMGAITLLACDLRLGYFNKDAKSQPKLGLNEANIGMRIPLIGLELAKKKMHPAQLDILLAQGGILTPPQAVGAAGYLDEVLEGNDVDEFFAKCEERAGKLGAYVKQPAFAEIREQLREDLVTRKSEFKLDIDKYRPT